MASRSSMSASTLSRSSAERGCVKSSSASNGSSGSSGSCCSIGSSATGSPLLGDGVVPVAVILTGRALGLCFLRIVLQAEGPERFGERHAGGLTALPGAFTDELVHGPVADLALVAPQCLDLEFDRLADVDEGVHVV